MTKEVKMKCLYLIAVSFILTVFLSGTVYANTSYTIKKGDNPSKIAEKFNVSTKALIRANNLKSYSLKPGTKITIPLDRKTSTGKKVVVNKKGKNTSTAGIRKSSLIHIVKKGDSLYSLSRKYSISVGELKEINKMKTTRLKTGQQLIVGKAEPAIYASNNKRPAHQSATEIQAERESGEHDNINDSLLEEGKSDEQMILAEYEEQTEDIKTYEAIISQDSHDSVPQTSSLSNELSEMCIQDRLILFAKKLLDIPYRFGGSSLLGIDCSAYVQKVYNVIGVNLPRSAREQFTEGDPVDKEELSIGDLVFFKTYASFPSHVGIYLGNNLFIHASSRSRKVTIDSLDTPYYFKRFIGAKRVIEGSSERMGSQREG